MSIWTVYWIMKLDALCTASTVLVALGVGIFLIGFFVACIAEFEEGTNGVARKVILTGLPLLIVFGSARVLLPTTKQMAALYVVPSVVNYVEQSEGLKALPHEIIKLGNDWLKELSPDKKGGAQ